MLWGGAEEAVAPRGGKGELLEWDAGPAEGERALETEGAAAMTPTLEALALLARVPADLLLLSIVLTSPPLPPPLLPAAFPLLFVLAAFAEALGTTNGPFAAALPAPPPVLGLLVLLLGGGLA